jgi:hypothetical protein
MPTLELVSERFRESIVTETYIDVADANLAIYYVFGGRSVPYANDDSAIIQSSDSYHDLVVDAYQNMLFGKLVTQDDIVPMASRYDWVANTVYAMYSDTDQNLYTENFYAVVNSTSQYDVFKCIFNNYGSESLYQPTLSDTNPSEPYYETADGYFWKYMFSIPVASFTQFATTNFIPVYPNTAVANSAVDGAIDVILLANDQFGALEAGSGYNNYLEAQFIISDIQVAGNTILYGVANNASVVNGFYIGCMLYINGGTGSGQFVEIIDYKITGNIKQIVLNNPLPIVPDVTSTYQIYPMVQITGDQNVTVNAYARALVNAFSSNSIYQIDVVQHGVGYRIAEATILSDPSVGVSNNAVLNVIISPPGGHGFDAYNELGATSIGIGLTFANNEGNTISTGNEYRTVGIIKNPRFANVQLNLLTSTGSPGTNGSFLFNETILQFVPILLSGTVAVTGNTTVTGTNTDFENQFALSNNIYINGGSSVYIGTIASIVNSSVLILSSNCPFTNSVSNVAIASISANAMITGTSTNTINITNVTPTFVIGGTIIGTQSFATANIASYTINDVDKTFETYIQTNRYIGSVSSGTFDPSEQVFQGNLTTANASFNSLFLAGDEGIGQISMLVSNQVGIFYPNTAIQGSESGAVFDVVSVFPGDLMLDNGDVIYLENSAPIPRSNTQSEIVKIIIELENNS